ncbi:MYG1 family protein [Runella salmonicolor]|uniref:MYG1 family protein n=1 Tax=Runella salmonicolor TaxID=2950278 RepID=A0ABT1FSY1_9BACT|nr:MYG1 family protein [Runella salmonicolor]MCP1384854.1 MYG1 family protein [Runella salmonicolor]
MKNFKVSRIITHDTTFHADEVFAVALLKICGFHEVPVIRTRRKEILEDALLDPTAFVIDVGGSYNPGMLNFDHHQDTSLPSAAGLIWKMMNYCFHDDLIPHFDAFFAAIDAVDTNRDNIYELLHTLPEGFRNASSIISGFNRDVTDPQEQKEQFNDAVNVAMMILQNEHHSAIEHVRSEKEYADREILPNGVAVFKTFNTIWKKKDDHTFAVMPHANGWQIQSRDTALAVVPENVSECEGFIFRHGSGFMATVKDFEVAVEFARSILTEDPELPFNY